MNCNIGHQKLSNLENREKKDWKIMSTAAAMTCERMAKGSASGKLDPQRDQQKHGAGKLNKWLV